MSKPRYDNPLTATLSGIRNFWKPKGEQINVGQKERIDGKQVMITGANSGLGLALSVDLAARGGNLIMACRSGIPEAGKKVTRLSGSDAVQMEKVDLADLNSIESLVKRLAARRVRLDRVVLNAAVVPAGDRQTPQGLEQMFVVNFLAKVLLLDRLLDSGVLKPASAEEPLPRVVFVSSESHRGAPDLDIGRLGVYAGFGMGQVVALYGYYKLALTTLASHLHRLLYLPSNTGVAVHSLCPGAVNTNIAREAPAVFKPLIKIVFGLFFQSPQKAALPVSYLVSSKELDGKSGAYLHMRTPKQIDPRATDKDTGEALLARAGALLDEAGYPLNYLLGEKIAAKKDHKG